MKKLVLLKGGWVPLFFSVSNSKETPFLESCVSSVLAGRAKKLTFGLDCDRTSDTNLYNKRLVQVDYSKLHGHTVDTT